MPTLQKLSELDASGTRQVVSKILFTYERTLEKAVFELQEAARINDAGGLGRVAHTLRSSSASVGALGLSALCGTFENAVRQGQAVSVEASCNALTAECRKVAVAVRQLLVARGYSS